MSWPMVKISDFCVTGSGGTPLRSNSAFYDGDIPWIKSGELRENMITKASEFITELAVEKSSAKIVPAGSILLAMYGATVGRMAILGIDATTNQAICNIIPDKEIALPKYVYYALLNRVPYFLNNAVGGAQPNISQGIIKDTEIPLPPLPEQKRIAAILDKADSLRRKNQQAIQLADQFLRAVFLDMFGDPVSNPKKWSKRQLEDICLQVIDCPHSTPEWTNAGVIGLRTSNLTKGGWNWDDRRFVSEETYKERTKRAELKANDIILSREGTVGVAALVPEDVRMCMGQRLVQLRVNTDILTSEYMLFLLLYELEPERLSKVMTGSTSKHLNVKDLRKLSVAIPPIEKQQFFSKIFTKIK
ncbi:MAG: restriction endonuclease subunit S, partial [Methylobacter sp.]